MEFFLLISSKLTGKRKQINIKDFEKLPYVCRVSVENSEDSEYSSYVQNNKRLIQTEISAQRFCAGGRET